jgi:hypothetical protein
MCNNQRHVGEKKSNNVSFRMQFSQRHVFFYVKTLGRTNIHGLKAYTLDKSKDFFIPYDYCQMGGI